MSLTREELQQRTAYIGSSDVPAILGVDEYRTITDVYLSKIGALEIEPTSSLAADLGSRLEPALVTWAHDRLEDEHGPLELELDRRFMHENGIFSAQCDGWLPSLAEPIEAKTHGLVSPVWDGSEWGADGSDEIPFRTLAQVNFSMLVTGARKAHVVALLGRGMGPRFYVVNRVEPLVAEIAERCERFWRENVEKCVPPEALASLSVMKTRLREPSLMTSVDPMLAERWQSLKDQEALVKAAIDEAKGDVLAQMELEDGRAAEIGSTPWGDFEYKANRNGVRRFIYKEKTA